MDAIEVLKTRRSVRTYRGEPVPRKIIEDIVDCGCLAATAINIQPWEFVLMTDPGMLRRIATTTDYGKFIADAPVCVLVLCRDTKYYLEDGSAATLPDALTAMSRLCLLHYRVDEKTVLTRLPKPDARQEEILKALQVPLPGQSL